MGFDDGRVVLDSSNGTYFAGQTVHAKLIFDQDKVKTFRGLYVRMKGYCETHWETEHTRRVNDREETYTEHHGASEVYFEMKQYLLGGTQGEYHLQPGHHEFPFYCQIPDNCPSSFEGSHGFVRYELKIVIDRAFKFDQEKLIAFRVIAPHNLNNDPYAREPMQLDFENTYCCWCMNRGFSETLIKLPVSGYCPGQTIPMEVSCNNSSGVEIDCIKFKIRKNVVFRADDQTARYEEGTIAELKKGPISANTTKNWTVEMAVPDFDVYNMGPCRFIDIDYTFEVKVCPDGCHEDSEQTRRLVIGTIPIQGFQDNVQNPLQDQMPNIQEFPSTHQPITAQPGYPGTQTYPSNQGYPGNQGYPNMGNQGYPNPGNQGYPNPGNQGYPSVSAYPGSNQGGSPYPAPNQPYPSTQPNQPYPGISPYPNTQVSPYPGNTQVSPYPGSVPAVGFTMDDARQNSSNPSMPLLPHGAGLPYPSGAPTYASPTAPAPGTPDGNYKADEIPKQPAYNPELTK